MSESVGLGQKEMRVFAIRMGDMVEYRASKTVPKTIRSSYTRNTKGGNLKWKLEQKFYQGGEVLGVAPYNMYLHFWITLVDWNVYPPKYLEHDGIAELPKTYATKVLSQTWREENL